MKLVVVEGCMLTCISYVVDRHSPWRVFEQQ